MSTAFAQLRAGCARVCITPDVPCVNLAGYFHDRPATSVARDLYAGVLALEQDGNFAVVVSCDLIAMTDEISAPSFAAAHERCGLPRSAFIACATHTHTGPEIRRYLLDRAEEYIPKVQALLKEAVLAALDNMFDAVLSVGVTTAPGLCHNRLSRCADGTEIFGGAPPGVRVVGAAGPQDNSVQTLAVYDTRKNLRAVAVNFACHPDLSGGGRATAVDSCWPGEMCDYLTRVYGDEVVPIFWQGTAGDVNQADHRAKAPRWLPDGRSTVARGVAGATLYALETAGVLAAPHLASCRRELDLPYYTRDDRLRAYIETLKAKGDAATYFEQNQVKRYEAWDKDGKSDHIGINCLRLGDIAIVGMPGEIFSAWGLEIKRYSPARQTFILELASSDGLTGYKATVDQCLRGARCRGAYGALPCLSQRHVPWAGQLMAEAVIDMLCELFPEEYPQ